MTDRVRTLIVILEHDTRDDDAEVVMQAIRLLRGVADVKLGHVVDGGVSSPAKLYEALK